MTTKIELEKMRFYAYHGVMPQETKVGNDFVVDQLCGRLCGCKRADGYPFQADRTCGRTDFVCSEGAFPPAGSSRVETL